jgi:crotonobetaine/carnitine-CoA ligase
MSKDALALQPLENRTVPDLLDRSASFGLDRVWVTEAQSGKVLHYGEFLERTAQTAHKLRARFVPGSHIAMMQSNTIEFFIVRFAISVAGMVEVSLNGEQKGTVLKGMLETTQPVAFIVEEQYLGNLTDCGFDLSSSSLIVGREIQALCAQHSPWSERPQVDILPSDPCRILFTSGTSGVSKAAVLSHAYEVYVGKAYADSDTLRGDDKFLYTTRLFHADAQFLISTLLHIGASFILMTHFSASQFWPLALRYGATSFLFVGTILAILIKGEKPPAGHKMRLAFGGGCPGPIWERWSEHTAIPVVEAFAMTECIACTLNTLKNPKIGSQGKPLAGYQVAVVDQFDRKLASGERGEIVIRSEEPFALMSGYLNNPQATLERYRNLWFHTGDMGSMDEEGWLYFHGRLKDALRVKGENVSAEELQNIADDHESIVSTAAVGVASEMGDEEILLYVQLKSGHTIDPQQLCEFIAERAVAFMVPRYVRLVESLPRSVSEKVSKTTLSRQPDEKTWERPDAVR